MDIHESIRPPKSPQEKRTTFVGHAVVNGLGVLSVTAMHLFGSLNAEWAIAAVLLICGVWGANTLKGPPPGSTGLVALAGFLESMIRR